MPRRVIYRDFGSLNPSSFQRTMQRIEGAEYAGGDGAHFFYQLTHQGVTLEFAYWPPVFFFASEARITGTGTQEKLDKAEQLLRSILR